MDNPGALALTAFRARRLCDRRALRLKEGGYVHRTSSTTAPDGRLRYGMLSTRASIGGGLPSPDLCKQREVRDRMRGTSCGRRASGVTGGH
jgi:hypothetical protein